MSVWLVGDPYEGEGCRPCSAGIPRAPVHRAIIMSGIPSRGPTDCQPTDAVTLRRIPAWPWLSKARAAGEGAHTDPEMWQPGRPCGVRALCTLGVVLGHETSVRWGSCLAEKDACC